MSQTKAQLLDGSVVSVSFGAGSAAAPSINYSADTTTGIYFPGSGQLAISTSGSGRLLMDASGRVGIGTTSPGAFVVNNLVIEGSSNPGITISNSSGAGTASLFFAATSSFQSKGEIACDIPTGALAFKVASTERARIDGSGRLLVGVSANANGGILQLSSGITFPATAVAASDANTLDDYEEGSWTPVYTASTTNPTMVYNAAEGRYTKVGRLVTCYFHMRTNTSSTGGGVGDLLVSGLPFTSANIDVNAGRQSGAIGASSNFGSLNYPNGIIVNNNSTTAALQIISTTASTTAVNASTLSLANQGNSLFGCFSYITG